MGYAAGFDWQWEELTKRKIGELLGERLAKGRAQYGKLDPNKKQSREWLQELVEELLDGFVYAYMLATKLGMYQPDPPNGGKRPGLCPHTDADGMPGCRKCGIAAVEEEREATTASDEELRAEVTRLRDLHIEIRKALNAGPDESTVGAAKRVVQERDSLVIAGEDLHATWDDLRGQIKAWQRACGAEREQGAREERARIVDAIERGEHDEKANA
jgi:hypothetical protein